MLCFVGSLLQSSTENNAKSMVVPSASSDVVHVELNLEASADHMRLGEKPITLRVELRNQGPEVFYASRNLDSILNSPGYVVIEVTNAAKQTTLLYSLESSFRQRGAEHEWWFGILPQHYYGTFIVLDSSMQDSLRTPGAYELIAKYVSQGGTIPAAPDLGIASHTAWKGEIKSNSIRIAVLPSQRSRQK